MQSGPARRVARARGGGQALGGDAARRDGRDRRRAKSRARAGGRDHPVLAPRSVAFGYRAGLRDARQGGAARHRATAALCLMRGARAAGALRPFSDLPATASKRLRPGKRQGPTMPEPQPESHWRVSLPMYNLPEMQAVNSHFWEAIRRELERQGIESVP